MNNKKIIQRKTKILATLGPSSNTIKKIIELSKAGANAFRLNCSHLNERSLKDYVRKIRRAEKILNKPIGILVDLQGPKIRIGTVKNDDTTTTVNSKSSELEGMMFGFGIQSVELANGIVARAEYTFTDFDDISVTTTSNGSASVKKTASGELETLTFSIAKSF